MKIHYNKSFHFPLFESYGLLIAIIIITVGMSLGVYK